MYAIAFDLVVANTLENHPKGTSQAYIDIGGTLAQFNFERVQGSNLFMAIQALMKMSWFSDSVRDIRAFRIEQWSDFTPMVKQQN